MSQRTTIAVDLSKSVFQVASSREPGRVDSHRRLNRSRMMEFFAQQPPALVLMEACGTSHYWGRQLRALGHEVMLLPAQHVRRYRLGNKTDRADAEAMLEAYRRGSLRPVPVKSVEQQAIGALHSLRAGWMSTRVARLNALRGVAREFGVVIPMGAQRVLPAVREALRTEALPASLRTPLAELMSEVEELERRLEMLERQLSKLSAEDLTVKRLQTIPGIGLLSSTALVAGVVDARRFASGRHLASYVGLTPREHSSGLKRRLGSISKSGDGYLRMLLIQGARSVLCHAARREKPDRLRAWALRVAAKRGHNRAVVALANRLARIIWAVWTKQHDFVSQPADQLAA